MPSITSIEHNPPFGFRIWKHAPKQLCMALPHTHTDVEINFLTRGRILYLHGGRRIIIQSGQLALFWAGVPHQILEAEQQPRGIWITLPLPWLLNWNLPRGLAQALLKGDLVRASESENPADCETLTRWLEDVHTGDSQYRRVFLLELQARLHRLGLEYESETSLPDSSSANLRNNGSMDRVLHAVSEHFLEPVRIRDIAERVGLHPNYLQQRFREWTGLTIWDYITGLRLAHAQRLLLTTQLNVLGVAMESGFGSQSTFYRAFLNAIGQTPGQYRRKHRLFSDDVSASNSPV